MPVYVQLFHGRKAPDQDMADWGEPGPVFVVDWFHVTYVNHIRMGNDGDDNMELNLVEDMLYYDGMYYGDWSVFSDSSVEIEAFRDRFQMYDAAKAVVPARPPVPNDKKRWIEEEMINALDAGVFLDPNNPELRAYAERGWEREQAAQSKSEGVVQTVDEDDDEVTIVLRRNDAGQVLDGIRARKEQWDNTVLNWRDALVGLDAVICESSSEEEAQKIAAHYGKLVEQLEAQL